MKAFWTRLEGDLVKVKDAKEKASITNITCPACNKGKLVIKHSRYGPFYSCSMRTDKENKCEAIFQIGENNEPIEKVKKEIVYSDYDCPKCGAKMVERNSKRGKFFGCSNYFKTKCNGMRDAEGNVIEYKKKSYKKSSFKKKTSKKKKK